MQACFLTMTVSILRILSLSLLDIDSFAVVRGYNKDIEFWVRHIETNQAIVDGKAHAIAELRNQIDSHEIERTKAMRQIMGAFEHGQRSMAGCAGSVLEVANQQRRIIRQHAADMFPEYVQVEAAMNYTKQQCEELKSQYKSVKEFDERMKAFPAEFEAFRKEKDEFEARKAEFEAIVAGAQLDGNTQVQDAGASQNTNAQVQRVDTQSEEVEHGINGAQAGNAEADQTGQSHTG